MPAEKRAKTKKSPGRRSRVADASRPDFSDLPPEERDRAYQKWYYSQNKERRSQYKAEKYRDDPEYRDRAVTRAGRQYWYAQRKAKKTKWVEPLPLLEMTPIAVVDVTLKSGGTRQARFYTLRQVAEMLSRTSYTLLEWERNGWLPKPYWEAAQAGVVLRGRAPRIYTADEMQVIAFAGALLNLPYAAVADSLFVRSVSEGFKALREGFRAP